MVDVTRGPGEFLADGWMLLKGSEGFLADGGCYYAGGHHNSHPSSCSCCRNFLPQADFQFPAGLCGYVGSA